jgi:HEAT repeat protein
MVSAQAERIGMNLTMARIIAHAALLFSLLTFSSNTARCAMAGTVEPPPDPGFENSVRAADVIAEVEILAGGPFRAVGRATKVLKGKVPQSQVFELEGYNSFNWDTAHQGFSTGSQYLLFLSRTGRDDVFAPLTPAAPRLSIQQEGVLLELGDPPFRVPVRKAALEEGIVLLLEANETGKVPDRAQTFLQKLWDDGDIETRYLAVALGSALRDPRAASLLIAASKDKVLKLRLTAVGALGKIKSTETLRALRILLKDEKPSVAREAARMLAQNGDSASLPELLEWVRRYVIAQGKNTAATKLSDAERIKAETVALEILIMALDVGALLDRASLTQPLFEIARSKHEKLAKAALIVVGEIAQAQEIPTLFELADDMTFDWQQQASAVLQRVVVKYFKNAAEFREWWNATRASFGEDTRRDLVESYAKKLATAEDNSERRPLLDLLRAAPGEIAVVSCAPFLLEEDNRSSITAEDMMVWRTALTLPFLIERLGREGSSERQYALQALVRLCQKHPRLNAPLWPIVRAGLAEADSSYRRMSELGAGIMAQPEAMTALLDSLEFYGGYSTSEAGKSVYELTCRTLGFSPAEPLPEEAAARRRLRGWWQDAEKNFKPISPNSPIVRNFGVDLDLTERAAKLETMLLSADSRTAGAAFTFAFAERPAADALWQKMSAMPRQRDKAHGLLAQIGGSAALQDAFVSRLNGAEESPLSRALSLVMLASLADAPGKSEPLIAWLKGPALKLPVGWRRLGIISLAMLDKDPRSLAYLGEILAPALESKTDLVSILTDTPNAEAQLLRSIMIALCARSDSTPLLIEVLKKTKSSSVRETAARALSIRRHRPAATHIFVALEKSEYLEWRDLSQIAMPLLKDEDAVVLRELSDAKDSVVRNAATWLLAARPDIGRDEIMNRALIKRLEDSSDYVRYYAAQALGKRRAVSAAKDLRKLITDSDETIRTVAAEAIALIGDINGCQLAAEQFEKEWRPDTRWLRALAIGGNNDQFNLLLKAANSTVYAEQRGAIEALGAATRPAGFDAALKVFRNDESPMQTVAAEALAERGDAAISGLKLDLASDDKAVRARAIYLLSRINTVASRSALTAATNDKEESLRALAHFALGRMGK